MPDLTLQDIELHLDGKEQEFTQVVAEKAALTEQMRALVEKEKQLASRADYLQKDISISRAYVQMRKRQDTAPVLVVPQSTSTGKMPRALKRQKIVKTTKPTPSTVSSKGSKAANQPQGEVENKVKRTRLAPGGRGKIADACERVLQRHGYVKRQELFDLLAQDEQLMREGIIVPGTRGGNYLSSLLSEDEARFATNRKKGWSLVRT